MSFSEQLKKSYTWQRMWTLTQGKTVILHLHSGRLLNTLHRRGRITLDSMILKHFKCWADIANFENILRMTAFKGCASVAKWLPRVREAQVPFPQSPLLTKINSNQHRVCLKVYMLKHIKGRRTHRINKFTEFFVIWSSFQF